MLYDKLITTANVDCGILRPLTYSQPTKLNSVDYGWSDLISSLINLYWNGLIDLLRFSLTQQNLDGAFAHVIVTVKCLAIEGSHFMTNMSAVVVEEFNETF